MYTNKGSDFRLNPLLTVAFAAAILTCPQRAAAAPMPGGIGAEPGSATLVSIGIGLVILALARRRPR
jgi:hypothetical protein